MVYWGKYGACNSYHWYTGLYFACIGSSILAKTQMVTKNNHEPGKRYSIHGKDKSFINHNCLP